jgi:hypothetical protein
MSQPFGTARGRLVGAILGLAGSILVLLGFIEPWLPTKIYGLAPCTPEQRGCADYYVTATVTWQHVTRNAHSLYHDFPSPTFLLISLVLAVVPLAISLFALARVPTRPVLALDAAAVLLGSLVLVGLCLYAAYASTGLAIQLHNEPGRLAPTLWLFLGYALIWAGWWLLTRARRASKTKKG